MRIGTGQPDGYPLTLRGTREEVASVRAEFEGRDVQIVPADEPRSADLDSRLEAGDPVRRIVEAVARWSDDEFEKNVREEPEVYDGPTGDEIIAAYDAGKIKIGGKE